MVKDGSGQDHSQAEGLMFVRKTSISPRSTWIQMDATGHSSLLDADMYDIMHRVQINARDLRVLDPFLSYPSTIVGREKAIVLNLEHIKAIITVEEVLLQDTSDENVVPVLEELKRRLANIQTYQGDIQVEGYPGALHEIEAADGDDSPFEFRVLEVALESICSFLAARTTELEVDAYPALDELTSKMSSRNLDKVRKLKSSITRLTARVQKVRDELERVMDDDDDMADLYLSRKSAGASSPIKASVIALLGDENDVEELEMLLEAYFRHINGTLNKLTTLRGYIDDTEDYINIQIDSHRNQLIQLDLFLNSGHISLAFFSMLTGIFGMNFPFSWNREHGYLFKWVVIFIGACSTIIFLWIIAYARKKGLVG